MTSVVPARRRAEEFATLVDAGAVDDPRHAVLLEVVATLRALEPAAPRAEYVADLRDRLMAEADVALTTVDHRLMLPPHTRTRRDHRLAVVTGTIVALGATSSVAVAAQNALPGEVLYPIKRAIESVQTTVQTDDIARAERILDIASGRLAEASELARRGGDAEAALPETLQDFTDHALEASNLLLGEYAETGDASVIEKLRAFASESMSTLAAIDALVPTELRAELNAVALALAQIDEMAAEACPSCGGGITELPSMFLLAARPGAGGAEVSPAPAPETTEVAPAPEPDLLENLTGGGHGSDTEEDEPQTSPEAPATEPPDGRTGTSVEPKQPLRDLTDELLGTGDDEQGLVQDLLDPVTGEGGLLNP